MITIHRVKRSTSRDVARLAGVSHTTVPFVVNEVSHANISTATRARVRRATARLEYRPHAAARRVGRRATRALGVDIPDATNLHYVEH